MDAVQFALIPAENMTYDRILLKEIIHHIPETQFSTLFKGIFQQLSSEGILLIITRPQTVNYPLFTRAREIWAANQPAASTISSHLEAFLFYFLKVYIHVKSSNIMTILLLGEWVCCGDFYA